MYCKAEAGVIINSVEVGQINVLPSTSQGCPLSPILLAFLIEPLARANRANESIQPPLPHMDKIKLYADDIMLIVDSRNETQEKLFGVFAQYETLGGYRTNKSKTEIIFGGCTPEVLLPDVAVCVNSQPKQYLGIRFSSKIIDLYDLNYSPLLTKVQHLFSRWISLPLTILGRGYLIKMSVLHLFNFLFSAILCVLTTSF